MNWPLRPMSLVVGGVVPPENVQVRSGAISAPNICRSDIQVRPPIPTPFVAYQSHAP